MFFLLRVVFWLSVVILFLPGDPDGNAPRVGLFQALGAARATVADLAGFCGRNPEVCDTGHSVVEVMGDKARYGVRQLRDYLDGEDGAPAGTLTPEDVAAPWHGPGDATSKEG